MTECDALARPDHPSLRLGLKVAQPGEGSLKYGIGGMSWLQRFQVTGRIGALEKSVHRAHQID